MGYDSYGRVQSDVRHNTVNAETYRADYTYLADSMVAAEAVAPAAVAGAGTHSYVYDQAGRLTNWTGPAGSVGYSWDKAGNRLTSGATAFVYDARNRQTSAGGVSNCYDTGPPPDGEGSLGKPADVALLVAQGESEWLVGSASAKADYRLDAVVRVPLDGKPGAASLVARSSSGRSPVRSVLHFSITGAARANPPHRLPRWPPASRCGRADRPTLRHRLSPAAVRWFRMSPPAGGRRQRRSC